MYLKKYMYNVNMRRRRRLSQSAGYNHVHKSELTAHL